MPIDVKIVDAAKNVKTVTLHDRDPYDVEIRTALGGGTDVDIHVVGQMDGYEVIKLSGGTDRMVIGAAPYIDGPIKARINCTLSDREAVGVVSNFP